MYFTRRSILKLYGLSGLGIGTFPALLSFSHNANILRRTIPGATEQLPVVGLGTWQTFDAGDSQEELDRLKQVLLEMKKLGGKVIDSSPMYGRSEAVVGELTSKITKRDDFFYATKVWTSGKQAGIDQMNASFQKMQRKTIDLMQIHNLIDWQTHVKTLRAWKEESKIRYWGLTHYTDSSHDKLEKIIKQERPDFVQFNYSILSRHAEKSLFDTCQKHRTAVIINQPFESGSLFRKVKGKSLPDWCEAYDIKSWGHYFLKFILSNEAVTCVIPGTSKPKHVIDNMGAGYGKLPNMAEREKMAKYMASL